MVPPEVAVAEVDPVVEAAKAFATRDLTVTPPVESQEKPPEGSAPAATETDPAGGATPESQEESPAASEGKDDDGSEKTKALRALVDEDPALALVPQIRERLGLPPLQKDDPAPTPSKAPTAPLVFDGKIPTEEEFMAEYEKRMKANDEAGAIGVIASAKTAPLAAAVQFLLNDRARLIAANAFVTKHKDWEKHKGALDAEIERRVAQGKPIDLEDVWNAAVRPGPAPSTSVADAAAAVRTAAAAVKSDKTRAAASAAGAPTNQRAAGVPTPAREPTASEKALASVLGEKRPVPQLYDPAALERRRK